MFSSILLEGRVAGDPKTEDGIVFCSCKCKTF
jgi:hypothetical protein